MSRGKRKVSTCHPPLPAKAFGLCISCYRHDYYLRHRQQQIDAARRWVWASEEHHQRHLASKKKYRDSVKYWLDNIPEGG